MLNNMNSGMVRAIDEKQESCFGPVNYVQAYHTAKNGEKKICPFLENEEFFLKMSIFFSKRRIIRRFEGKKSSF